MGNYEGPLSRGGAGNSIGFLDGAGKEPAVEIV
jgi:hypothetical protein